MAHNGGITQMNMSHRQYGGDFPFVNPFKNGQGWGSIDGTTPIDPTKHDNDGWPTETYGLGQRDKFFTPTQASRPGNYIIDWTGDGTAVPSGLSLVSGSLSSSLTRRAVVSVTSDTNKLLGVSPTGASPMKNLRIYHEDDENGVINNNQMFGTRFLQRLHALKPGSMRFLDSINGNESGLRYWSNMTPLTHYTWAAPYRQKSLYAGVSTNSGNDYSCTLPGFALVHGAQVIFKVSATATDGVCRLNVSGTGFYPLKTAYINYNGTDTIPFSIQYPLINRLCPAMFDSNLGCWIMCGGDGVWFDGGFYSGWPAEVMIALCNEIGCHLSIPVPKMAANKDSDFLDEFATLCKNTLDSGLRLKVEGPNEEWNFANGFTSYYYGFYSDPANKFNRWYGQCISDMSEVLEGVFPSGLGVKYDLAIGVQTALTPTGTVLERFDTASAYTKANELHLANYWNASKKDEQEETDAAAAYAAAVGAPAKAAVVHTYMNAYAEEGLEEFFGRMATWYAYAVTKGLTMSAYEGGYSPDYTGTVEINTFREATKSWPGHYYLTCKMYRKFQKVYAGVFPSCYYFSGDGAWSIHDPDIYAADSPQYTAIVDTNAGKWPMRLTTS